MQCTRFRSVTVVGLAVSLVAASGCDSSPTGPESDHTQIAIAFATMASTAPVSNPDGQLVHPCPAGGSLIIDGSSTHEVQDDVLVATWNHTTLYDDCAINRNGTTVIATGQMELVGEARFDAIVHGHRQLTYQQSSQTGSMTIVYDGMSRTCAYDMQHEFESASRTYHITGTACGRAIDMRMSLPTT
jgi:hypothetical protein